MIIALDERRVTAARRSIFLLRDNAQKHVNEFNALGISQIKGDNKLRAFIEDGPIAYYEQELEKLAKERNIEFLDISKMSRFRYFPDVKRHPLEPYKQYVKYLKFISGSVEVVKDHEEEIQKLAVVEVTDPRLINAAKILRKLYYLSCLHDTTKRGSKTIITAGTRHLGFSALEHGNLSLQAVEEFADALDKWPLDEFNKKFLEMVKPPGYDSIVLQPVPETASAESE